MISVLIVGLLPQQAGFIQSEFGDTITLKFWKEGNLQQLKKQAQKADYALTFTNKIGHDAENTVKSACDNVIRVTGGLTKLRDTLTEMFCEEYRDEKLRGTYDEDYPDVDCS